MKNKLEVFNKLSNEITEYSRNVFTEKFRNKKGYSFVKWSIVNQTDLKVYYEDSNFKHKGIQSFVVKIN